MTVLKYIGIEKIMGYKVVSDDGSTFETEPKKINVITGCNGSLKTAFLEALVVSMDMMTNWGRDVYKRWLIASMLRGDTAWVYGLADGLEMTVNGYRVRSVDADDLARMGFRVRAQGVVLYKDGRPVAVRFRSATTNYSRVWDRSHVFENFSYIVLHMPEFISEEFVKMLTSVADFGTAIRIIREVLGFEAVYSRIDELNRFTLYVYKNGTEVPIHRLGRGMTNLLLLALASSTDVVIVEDVESSLHPQMMPKAVEIMYGSGSQWFVTTYSSDFLKHVLLERPDDVMVYRFEKKNEVLTISQFDGEQARKIFTDGSEDLRGNCYGHDGLSI